jgi:hypothetical protein
MKNELGSGPQDQPPKKSEPESPYRKLGLFGVILGDLVGYSGAGIGLGYFAWSRWGAPWWVLLVSGLLGMTWAFYKIYRLGQKEL